MNPLTFRPALNSQTNQIKRRVGQQQKMAAETMRNISYRPKKEEKLCSVTSAPFQMVRRRTSLNDAEQSHRRLHAGGISCGRKKYVTQRQT
jgi:hypothetical protein